MTEKNAHFGYIVILLRIILNLILNLNLNDFVV